MAAIAYERGAGRRFAKHFLGARRKITKRHGTPDYRPALLNHLFSLISVCSSPSIPSSMAMAAAAYQNDAGRRFPKRSFRVRRHISMLSFRRARMAAAAAAYEGDAERYFSERSSRRARMTTATYESDIERYFSKRLLSVRKHISQRSSRWTCMAAAAAAAYEDGVARHFLDARRQISKRSFWRACMAAAAYEDGAERLKRFLISKRTMDIDYSCMMDIDYSCMMDVDYSSMIDVDYSCMMDIDYSCMMDVDYSSMMNIDIAGLSW